MTHTAIDAREDERSLLPSGGLTRTLIDLVSFPGHVGRPGQPVEEPASTDNVT